MNLLRDKAEKRRENRSEWIWTEIREVCSSEESNRYSRDNSYYCTPLQTSTQ